MRKIIPYILGTLTQHDRQIVHVGVDFEWSNKSWTHNFFRAYEVVFGRRAGIRVEASSYMLNGKVIYEVYTLEAAIALVETKIREAFSFRFVPVRLYVSLLATPFGRVSPYLFAIAFDAVSSGNNGSTSVTTYTLSHTCTGSNLTLVSNSSGQAVSPAAPSTVTYNAASMTVADTGTIGSGISTSLWYKDSPSTGANNVVTTYPVSQSRIALGNISLTGCASPSIGGHANNSATSASASVSVTTTVANSFVVASVTTNSTTSSPVTGTNQTARYTFTILADHNTAGSTQTTTTTGSYTSSWTVGNDVWCTAGMEVKPMSGANTNSGFFAFM